MTTRIRDIDGARELTLDATSVVGSVFISGRGFTLEFDRGLLENALRKELGLEMVISIGELLGDSPLTPNEIDAFAPPASDGVRV